jgi:hypothetical protein
MRPRTLSLLLFLLLAAPAWPQSAAPPEESKKPATEGRYANMPVEAVPYRRFSKA